MLTFDLAPMTEMSLRFLIRSFLGIEFLVERERERCEGREGIVNPRKDGCGREVKRSAGEERLGVVYLMGVDCRWV